MPTRYSTPTGSYTQFCRFCKCYFQDVHIHLVRGCTSAPSPSAAPQPHPSSGQQRQQQEQDASLESAEQPGSAAAPAAPAQAAPDAAASPPAAPPPAAPPAPASPRSDASQGHDDPRDVALTTEQQQQQQLIQALEQHAGNQPPDNEASSALRLAPGGPLPTKRLRLAVGVPELAEACRQLPIRVADALLAALTGGSFKPEDVPFRSMAEMDRYLACICGRLVRLGRQLLLSSRMGKPRADTTGGSQSGGMQASPPDFPVLAGLGARAAVHMGRPASAVRGARRPQAILSAPGVQA